MVTIPVHRCAQTPDVPIALEETEPCEEQVEATPEQKAWQMGFESAVDEAISLIDAMRGPGMANLASPILLRIRAELIALRETGPATALAA